MTKKQRLIVGTILTVVGTGLVVLSQKIEEYIIIDQMVNESLRFPRCFFVKTDTDPAHVKSSLN